MEKVRNEKQSEKLNRKLSSDFYPVCWQDDERMDNLFAPFRSKTVNPVNYETKLKFWKNLIKEYGKETGSSVITINALRDAFLRNGQKPHCLHTVIEDQLNDGSIKRKEQFMQPPQHTWTGWAVHALIKSPLQWGFVKVKERIIPTAMGTSSSSSADDKNRFDNIEFVIIDVVKSQAEKLLATFNSTHDCLTVISTEELIKQLTDLNELTLDGVEAALHYLHCQQKASIQKTTIDNKDVTLCKLAVSMTRNVEPITPLDISIFTINKMEISLTKSVEAIENDIERTDGLVRQYVREKKKQLAKSFLRKKHVLEKNLVKTSNSLTTIQTLLLQIDETKHNAKIVEAFKLGTKTLKNALDDKNITVDNVEDALADVKEILETNADIQFALSGAQFNDIINDGSTDDETLEAELMDLLEDDGPATGGTINGGETGAALDKGNAENSTKSQSPSTITNVIDDLLEERLKKLQLENTINVTIDSNLNTNKDSLFAAQSANH